MDGNFLDCNILDFKKPLLSPLLFSSQVEQGIVKKPRFTWKQRSFLFKNCIKSYVRYQTPVQNNG